MPPKKQRRETQFTMHCKIEDKTKLVCSRGYASQEYLCLWCSLQPEEPTGIEVTFEHRNAAVTAILRKMQK